MPRVRMNVTRDRYEGGTEWIVSDADAAVWIERGEAEPIPDVAAESAASSITEGIPDEAERPEG